MDNKELAIKLHDYGFNVFSIVIEGNKKRPYIQLGKENPYQWQHLKQERLNKEQLLEAIDNATKERETCYLGVLPGKITEGKYTGYTFWGIDFDDPKNIEILGITPEKCRENGVWFEKSLNGGHHVYGISQDDMKYDKENDLGIELFPDNTFYIAVYGNFEDLYELKPTAINEVYPGFKNKLSEVKGIPLKKKKPTVPELKKGVKYPGRNNGAFKIAIDYRDKGLTIEETTKLMLLWNKNNLPPLPDSELLQCIKSAYNKEKPSRLKQTPEKEILLDKYEVFSKNKDGIKGNPNTAKLGLLINNEHGHFFTMRDSKEIYHYNPDKGYYEKNGDTIIKTLTEYYLDTWVCEHHKNETVGWIRDYNYKDRSEIIVPLHLINIKNGILDIDEGKIIPWTPDYLFLNQLPVEYNQDASYKNFEDFLNHICQNNGQPRIKTVETLQEYIGYGLLRSYPFKNYVVLDGGGDNGKTALLNIVKALFGDENNTSVGLQELNDRQFTRKQLYQKYVNISDDLPKKALRYTGIIKQVTGNSPLWADIKNHKDGISFTNFAKPWYACNELPETSDYTDAFFSRQLQITFTNKYLPTGDAKIDDKTVFERDTEIVTKLTTPGELSGLLNYALNGLKRLQENKRFSDDTATDEKRNQWTRKTNPVVAYIDDECELGDEETCMTVDDFYSEVIGYCERNKFDKPSSRKYVTDHVLDAGLGIRKQQKTIDGTPRVWCWIGIRSTTNELINRYLGKKEMDRVKQGTIA